MANPKPTVLFIPGLWHTPAHFEKVLKLFEEAGYPTSCNLHPSVETVPELGLADDAGLVREVLHTLIEKEGKDVIIIGHSYGGVVLSEAADQRLAKEVRLEEGTGIADAFGSVLPPGLLETYDGGMCMMSQPAVRFYHDISETEQQHAISELKKSPTELNFTHQTKANYLYHPVTYLYCEGDQGIFYPIQQKMVNDARNIGAKIKTEHCTASHSPFLSMPQRVLEVVQGLDQDESARTHSLQ